MVKSSSPPSSFSPFPPSFESSFFSSILKCLPHSSHSPPDEVQPQFSVAFFPYYSCFSPIFFQFSLYEFRAFSIPDNLTFFCFRHEAIGKSTLLSLISGLIKPEKGNILLHEKPIEQQKDKIGYMLQRDELLEWRSIFRNVLLGPEIQKSVTPDLKKRAHDLLMVYGLGQFESSKPSELSGGMRQRAALVRTLILNPELLLLDEPFSALDYQTRLNVSDDIGQIIRKEGKTALLVTHDLSEAISLADRVIVLSSRPAYVKSVICLSFAHKDGAEDTPLSRRNAPEFKYYFNLIWKELNQHEKEHF